ncbi:MAG: YgiQ family radical SAM protein [Chloroflexi bacterium HGW-Chloroflexi-10]|nr:MAG: YgiQ family radical SAM protein [Chloroflexi bacterium HGW-Chloroflexi-10]
MFLPTTSQEMKKLSWTKLDIILVSGDSYIDSPYIGTSVIGHVLVNAGFRVGIIAQPSLEKPEDILRLGEPELFWGITAGSIDSMVANYTASLKKRKQDDYTPGGENNRRPDRATIAYTNLIKHNIKNTVPIVLGGLEASLRRLAHYDFWSDKIRRSVLFDSKADFLIYGMAERSIVQLATALANHEPVKTIRGLCYIAKDAVEDYITLPAYEEVLSDKNAFIDSFHSFYRNNDPLTAKGLNQKHGDRYLIQNPPAFYLNQSELDSVYDLPYERNLHPYYAASGPVRALETIRFSINTHRGCYGECNFCAIAVHEGRTVRWRSKKSILSEAELLTKTPGFKGNIADLGGPTANMYGYECNKKINRGSCQDRRCLFPVICTALRPTHQPQIELLESIRNLPGIKKVFVASGIRYDLILNDRRYGNKYLSEIVENHISGQMKIAPEHVTPRVLNMMGKPGSDSLKAFKLKFDQLNKQMGKNQFLTYYFIAAHPGCSEDDMLKARDFASKELHVHPEQVQIFTPTPSTYASVMYYTEMNPFTREPIFVEKNLQRKTRQKEILVSKPERS